MDRFGILGSSTAGDDQALETDIMRFLAIIGIVFWIIFSVIKSIPFQGETKVSSIAAQTRSNETSQIIKDELPENFTETLAPMTASELKPEPRIKEDVEQQPRTGLLANPYAKRKTDDDFLSQQVKKNETKTEKPEKKLYPMAQVPASRGINLEFQSLDAIMKLVRNDRLLVYGRTKGTGFDLIFLGMPVGDTVRFKSTREIPREMWEIKEGQARGFFLNLMEKNFPAIRTFPEKKIQVAFLDEILEQQVIEKMEYLQYSSQNGTLSVTGDGELIFNDQN